MGVLDVVRRMLGKQRSPVPIASTFAGALYPDPVSRSALEHYRGWVYAAARKIALLGAMVDVKLYRSRRDRRGRDIDEVVWQHPIVDLLERVNPLMTRFDFKYLTLLWLDLMGEAAWAKVRAGEAIEATGRPAPRELWPLRPDRLQLVLADDGLTVKGFVYNAPDGRQVPFDRDDVIFLRYPDPANPWRGTGSVRAAALAIETDEFAARWHRQFFRQGTQLGGIIESDWNLSEEQYQRIKAQFQQMYQGIEGAHRVAILGGGLKFKETGMKVVDMELIEGRKYNRDEILAALGVSPPILGIYEDVNRASAEGAIFLFMATEIAPRLQLLDEQLNEQLVPDFGEPDLWLKHDDPVPENRELRVRELEMASGRGAISLNELREALGYNPEPRYDVALMPVNMVPVAAQGDDSGNKALNVAGEERKAAYWKAFERRREGWYRKAADLIENRFRIEARAVAAAYRRGGEQAALAEIEEQGEAWAEVLGRLHAAVAEDFGKATFEELKAQAGPAEVKQFAFDRALEAWLAAVAARRIKDISETTKALVAEVIRAAVAEGQDTDRIAEAIRRAYAQFGPVRAERIARTEVVAASNAGSQAAARQSGLPLEKEWVATRDGRTRDDHAAADGQRVPLDEPFVVGGERLMFPGDPSLGASAGNLVNCRCTEVYHVVRR